MMVSQEFGAKPRIPKGMAVAQWHHSKWMAALEHGPMEKGLSYI